MSTSLGSFDPLSWIRSKWAEITNLPDRLTAVETEAIAIVRDTDGYPLSVRQHAADIAVEARDDRAKVLNLLNRHLEVRDLRGIRDGLGAVPVVWVVGGLSAAAAAGTLLAVLRRSREYELELDAIRSGAATPDEIVRLRDERGGVTETIRAASDFLRVALIGGAAYYAYKQWGTR